MSAAAPQSHTTSAPPHDPPTRRAGESPPIRIGCYGAMWGDSAIALPQLLRSNGVDFVVADYLAEFTMGILARQKEKDPKEGYCRDFVTREMRLHLPTILKKGVRVVVNAGGMNPEGCKNALVKLIKEQVGAGAIKSDKMPKIGVVVGDGALEGGRLKIGTMAASGTKPGVVPRDMFSGVVIPEESYKLMSANCYFGAGPIKEALDKGCDIVITGRCVDSALVLGILLHRFPSWEGDLDKLSQGTLAGHLVECLEGRGRTIPSHTPKIFLHFSRFLFA